MAGQPPRPAWFLAIRPLAPALAPPPPPAPLMRPLLRPPSIPAIQSPQVIATIPQMAPPLVANQPQALVTNAPPPVPSVPAIQPQVIATIPQMVPPVVAAQPQIVATTAPAPVPEPSVPVPTSPPTVVAAASPNPPNSPLVAGVTTTPVASPLLNNSQPKSPIVMDNATVVATPPTRSPAAAAAAAATPSPTPPPSATKSPRPNSSSRGGSPLVKHPSPSPAAEDISEKANSTTPSPELVKLLNSNTPFSPKALSRPPSPLTLPPARLRPELITEQKNLLVQPTIDKPMETPRENSNRVVSNEKKDPRTKDKGPSIISKKLPNHGERGMRIIAIAGENRGAVMELSSRHVRRSLLGGTNGDPSGSDNGEKSGNRDRSNKSNTSPSPVTTALLNSNVQGLNNSILYNCSFRNNDPGVHLSIKRASNDRHSKE